MSAWWWLPLGVAGVGAAALGALVRRLERQVGSLERVVWPSRRRPGG